MPRTRRQPAAELSRLPRIDRFSPAIALPWGEVEAHGANLGPYADQPPAVQTSGEPALVTMARPTRLSFQVTDALAECFVVVVNDQGASEPRTLQVAQLLADGLHPVSNPAVSPSGMAYATLSGQRGKETPVSVLRISPDGHSMPFLAGILNATGLAFSPNGELYVTSRADGAVYRVDAAGEYSTYAEGLGVATGAAFDSEGNLFVGDRSGTIFRIDPEQRIFVHATLEASVSAYHLAMGPESRLFVAGPTLSSDEAIWVIDARGEIGCWYRGLGRPQGLALDVEGNVYVAACLAGRRGLVRITPAGAAELLISANNLVGVAFSPLGKTLLATHEAVYETELGVEGYRPFAW